MTKSRDTFTNPVVAFPGLVNSNWDANWKNNFYFAVPSPNGKTLVLKVNKNGWKLNNWNDNNNGFVRPGLPKYSFEDKLSFVGQLFYEIFQLLFLFDLKKVW
jgi:hypothetical protein